MHWILDDKMHGCLAQKAYKCFWAFSKSTYLIPKDSLRNLDRFKTNFLGSVYAALIYSSTIQPLDSMIYADLSVLTSPYSHTNAFEGNVVKGQAS